MTGGFGFIRRSLTPSYGNGKRPSVVARAPWRVRKDKKEAGDARVWLLKGRAQTSLGQFSQALASFSESTKIETHDVAIWLARQMANAKLQSLSDAKLNYRAARNHCHSVKYDLYLRWSERIRRWPEGELEDLRAVLEDYSRKLKRGRQQDGRGAVGR